jgi:queuine tRNA-ribosyltransferase
MARTLSTEHGELRLPAFLPDATKGAVRAVDSQDLARCGVEGVVVNVYHLSARPGCRTVKAAGGIHRFMAWDRPVLSDSGGFQIYSLLAERQVLGSVSKRGFRYRKGPQGRRRILTPEKSVCLQFDLGSDIVLCLDHCTHPGAPKDEQRASVENTVAWARAGRSEFDRLCDRTGRRPFIFSAVQGGDDPALRRECAERLLEIGFDGWAYGGWPVTEDGRLLDAVATVAELLPKGVPLWGLGLGKPEHVARVSHSATRFLTA